MVLLGRGRRLAGLRSQEDESRARGNAPPHDVVPPWRDVASRGVLRARGSAPPQPRVGSMRGLPVESSTGSRARGSPPPHARSRSATPRSEREIAEPAENSLPCARLSGAVCDLFADCSDSAISVDRVDTLTVTKQGSSESVVRFASSGWRSVDTAKVRDNMLHYSENTGFHATSVPSASQIIATGFLQKGGGHRHGFPDAVMARKTIEDAWFSSKNCGVVLELNYYGQVSNYGTASRHADAAGWPWEGWRGRYCSQIGKHMHRREAGESALYLNEEAVEIVAVYVQNSEDAVKSLRRARLEYRNPSRRRR